MTESTTSSPHDAVLKPLCTPKLTRSESSRTTAQACDLQTLRLEPTSLLKKVYALTTRMFCGPLETSDGDGYIFCVIGR